MVAFIILNYKSFNDTIECIETINKLNGNKKIIVVDNNTLISQEKSEILKYNIDLVSLNQNLGFAKGNNAGCKYAVEKYNPDFLCVINSDTLIDQVNFIDQVNSLYKKYSFDILGPKILPNESDSCNPFHVYETLEQVENRIRYVKKIIKIYKNCILRKALEIYMVLKSIIVKKKPVEIINHDVTNVALHGCALIFSKKYYDKFDDVFFPETFLFHEEEFLWQRCQQNNLISLYSPQIEIYHKEGQSVQKEFDGRKYESIIFRNKEILKSLELLRTMMKKQKNEDVKI